MHLIEIPEKNYSKEIPSCLEEMKPDEFVFMAGLLYELYQGEIDVTDLKTMLVYKLLNIGHYKKKYIQLPDEEKFRVCENLAYVSDHIDFLFIEDFQEGKPVMKFNFNFVHNPVPVFPRKIHRGVFKKYYGPADALQDITFKQYVDAHAYFEHYTETGELESINKLAAILYLPKNKKYDTGEVSARARLISRLPIGYRFSVYLFFVACEHFLKEGDVEFEGETVSLKLLYETTLKEREMASKQKYNLKASLMSIGFTLAETGIFGPLEKVMEQNLYDILYLLYQQRVSYLNQLESYDKSK